MAAPLRGFRLRRPGSAQKFGAAAGSLRGLLRKGCRLLQVRAVGQGSRVSVPWVSVPCDRPDSSRWQAAGCASTRTGRS